MRRTKNFSYYDWSGFFGKLFRRKCHWNIFQLYVIWLLIVRLSVYFVHLFYQLFLNTHSIYCFYKTTFFIHETIKTLFYEVFSFDVKWSSCVFNIDKLRGNTKKCKAILRLSRCFLCCKCCFFSATTLLIIHH